jgi:hypothetical protein
MSSSGYNNTNLLLWSIASGAVVQLNSIIYVYCFRNFRFWYK